MTKLPSQPPAEDVLIVTREPAAFEGLADALTRTADQTGLAPVFGQTWVDAVAALSDSRRIVAAVVLELERAGSDELESLRAVRAAQPRPGIVVLGCEDADAQIGSLREGADEYVVKPGTDVPSMLLAVRRAVERRRLRQSEMLTFAMLGHDLRSPLQAIRMTLDGAVEGAKDNPGALRSFSRAQRAAARAAELVEDLMSLTVPGHVLSLELGTVDVIRLVEEVIEEVQAVRPGHQLVLSHRGSATVVADARRISQALGNLIHNAAQHGAPDAPVQVNVTCDGDVLEVAVHNVGEPISPAVEAWLFEPFARLGGRSGGAGLGLYIVREVARAHGGTVTIDPERADGVVFRFRIPTRRATAP